MVDLQPLKNYKELESHNVNVAKYVLIKATFHLFIAKTVATSII